MALLFTSSLSQYLAQASNLGITAVPCSFACWYNPTNNTGTQGCMAVCSTTLANYFDMDVSAGQERGIQAQQGAGSVSAISAGSLTAGAWNHVAVAFPDTSHVTVYLNGVSTSGSGTARTVGAVAEFLIGAFINRGTVNDFANGAIAYPAAWKAYGLTGTDASNLYNGGAGSDPRLLSTPPNASFSLLQNSAPFLDSVSRVNWTVHGAPTVVADPFSLGTNIPTLTAQAATFITTLNGTITSENSGGNSTVEGFQYGLTTAYGSQVQASGSFTTGAFSQGITGLAGGITYHFRSFAINPGGTGYSADATFTTGTQTKSGTGEVLYNGPNQLSNGTTSSGSVANLFDANNLTTWITSSNAAWVGLDCGAPVTLTRLRYTAQPTSEDLVPGSVINGDLSDSTFASPVALYTFPSTGGVNGAGRPNTGTLMNEVDLSLGSSYRYYNAQSGASSTFSFADLDFIGTWASGIYSQPVQPVLTPATGNWDQPTLVRLSCITLSAQIYYTTDGSTPSSASTLYTVPILVSAKTQINAIAIDNGLSTPNSRITTGYYFVPSILYSHQKRYDNRGYRITGGADRTFLDPVSNWWYRYEIIQDSATALGNQGHNVWKSADLRNWTYLGNIVGQPAGTQLASGTLQSLTTRMVVFYCSATGKYVSWSSEDNYVNHGVEVWQSTAPDGSVPWTLVTAYNSSNPMANGYSLGSFLGDLGGFVDPSTGLAYIIFNYGGNTETAYSQLDPSSYTNTLSTNTATYAQALEAHTVFYRNGEYFWISSLEMGDAWSLNEYATASAPIGPWSARVNPFVQVSGYTLPWSEGNPNYLLAYNSQSTEVIYIAGRNAYIWVGDDLYAQGGGVLEESNTKIFLPIAFPTSTSMTITWTAGTWFDGTACSPFALDTVFPTISGAPVAASGLSVTTGLLATWTNNEPKPAFIYLDNSNSPTFASGVVSEVLPIGATSFQVTAQSGTYYRVRTVNANGTNLSSVVTSGPYVDPNACRQ